MPESLISIFFPYNIEANRDRAKGDNLREMGQLTRNGTNEPKGKT